MKTPLPTAGSNRAYYRLTDDEGRTTILVQGTSRAENHAFIGLARHFAALGLSVPTVLEVSDDEMSYTQTDLGSTSLFDAVAAGRKSGSYTEEEAVLLERAMAALPRLQYEGAKGLDWSLCHPMQEMDGRAVMFDLNYFKYCFLKPSGVEFDEVRLQDDFERLVNDVLEPCCKTFQYRDFQARNVMVDADGQPWFIDFQGGRRGPALYDVASFVWQASARYPEELRRRLVDAYRRALPPEADQTDFDGRLQRMVLFRTLQVLGAYGFRGLVEGKPHFIESIPPAIENLNQLLEEGAAKKYSYLESVLYALVEKNRACMTPMAPKTPILTVTVKSFSYKRGLPADESGNGGGYYFDCRAPHNPGRYDEYKRLTGLDAPVIKFLEDDGEILQFLRHVYALVDAHVERYIERGFTHLMVCFGCTGGQHRSVYCAQHVAERLHRKYGVHVELEHREQGIKQTFHAKTQAH